MTNRNTILNELKELSPILAGQDPCSTPYGVPEGYFNTLPEHILALVNATDPLEKTNQPYSVPQGYFDQFAQSVLHRIKAMEENDPQEELKQTAPFLSGLRKENPYSIPQGYFEDLAGNITDGAKAIDLVNEELENLSPMMSQIRSLNPYTVPSGYFEELPGLILNKVTDAQETPVITMRFTRRFMQMAAAAVVTGLILFNGIRFLNIPFASSETSYVTSGGTDSSTILNHLSDAELENYLDGAGRNADATAMNETVTQGELNPENMKDLFAEVSDEELQQFLEGTGAQSETLTN